MHSFMKAFLRVTACILIFLILYSACECALLLYEGSAYVTLHDLANEEDLDVVVVGNSEAYCHFNPYLFQELTGLNSFNLSRTSSGIITHYYLMEEMFRNHQPEKVIVFFDPYTLASADETAFVQATIWPYLTSPVRRFEYALNLAAADNAYLDRLFPWRLYMPDSIAGLKYNLRDKVREVSKDNRFYEFSLSKLNAEPDSSYPGKGFSPLHSDYATTIDVINNQCTTGYVRKEYLIHDDIKEFIRKMDELCRKNNCQLIAVNVPRLPVYAIAHMLNIYDAEELFFAELGIPFWNFCYAKEKYMPRLDVSYYYNQTHLTWAGTDILTKALAKIISAYENGEDVTGYFYTTEEYLASIDYITNTWFQEKKQGDQIKLTAYANHGTTVVPEYCFAKIHADGTETVVQDYSAENVCLVQLEAGETVRLYARNASNPEQAPVSYEPA